MSITFFNVELVSLYLELKRAEGRGADMTEDIEDSHPVLMGAFTISNKQCRAYFRRNVLFWKIEAAPFESRTLPISDIIAVDYGNKNTFGRNRFKTNGKQ